jgi:DNA-binding beta-propeller fold protein YncE
MKGKIFLILLLAGIIYPQQQIDIPWPTLANSPWPMIAHDPQITGRSPYSGPKTPTIKWEIDLPYSVASGPIISENGTLFVGTAAWTGDDTNYFYAINPDGSIKWTFSTGKPSMNESGYLINNEGTIFFGSQSGWLYALDSSGSLKWKYDTGGNIFQRVMNTDLQGNIYIANNTRNLYSFSKDGELNWKVKYGSGFGARSVAFSPDGNTMYTTGQDSNLYALNLDGSIKWIYQCAIDLRSPLLVDNSGNIYLLPGCKRPWALVSLDSTSQIRWEYVIEDGDAGFTNTSPAMDYLGNIYYTYEVPTSSTWYSRIESVDYYGNYRWTYQFEQPGEDVDPLVVDKDGTVYCGSNWGYNYYAILNNGELLWQIPLEGGDIEYSTTIDSDGTLYIGKTKGQDEVTLIAIKDTGTVSIKETLFEIVENKLLQNHPNPFNPSTTIKYKLKEVGVVTIKLYNVLGKEIKTLVNEAKNKGTYTYNFDGSDLPSGVYIYQLRVNDFVSSKKLVLLK